MTSVPIGRSDGVLRLKPCDGVAFERNGSEVCIGHEHTPGYHATLSDPNSKLVADAAAEYAITFADQDIIDGIGHTAGDSKIYALAASAYLFVVSAVIDITAPPAALFDLWMKKNAVNVPSSNTQVQINSASVQQNLVVAFVTDLHVGDYVEFFYHASSTDARILAIAEQAGPPAIPACPSVIVAVARVGEPAWELG